MYGFEVGHGEASPGDCPCSKVEKVKSDHDGMPESQTLIHACLKLADIFLCCVLMHC
jgi:hypothetical protein